MSVFPASMLAMPPASADKRKGRPKAQDAPATLEQILDAAFRAFATYGYDGVACRTLNRELGVSHNLIHQRFGSKQALWYAAVDRAFGQQVTELATWFDPTLTDPLDPAQIAAHATLTADVITSGLRVDAPGR